MNRITDSVYISLIEIDRYPMNLKTLSLIDYLRQGGVVPPIKIAKLGNGRFIIRDGRHRLLAYKMLGREKIKATFSAISLYKI